MLDQIESALWTMPPPSSSEPKGVQKAQSWLRAYEAAADELFSLLPRSRWPELIEIMSILGGQE
jgi:hypothetical protein